MTCTLCKPKQSYLLFFDAFRNCREERKYDMSIKPLPPLTSRQKKTMADIIMVLQEVTSLRISFTTKAIYHYHYQSKNLPPLFLLGLMIGDDHSKGSPRMSHTTWSVSGLTPISYLQTIKHRSASKSDKIRLDGETEDKIGGQKIR